MARLKKGDTEVILSGRDRGKRGKVLNVFPQRQAALVERTNLVKHFERRSQTNPSGGIIEREAPMALSKLAIVCPRCNRPARLGMRLTNDTKTRVCKRCQEALP